MWECIEKMERFQKIVSTVELFLTSEKKPFDQEIHFISVRVCECSSKSLRLSFFYVSMLVQRRARVYNESDCEVNQGHVMNFASLIRCPRHSLRPRLPICFSRLVPSHNSFFWLSLWHSRNAERGKKIELHFWTESK